MVKLKRGRSADGSDDGREEQDADVPRVKKAKNPKLSKSSPAPNGNNEKGEPYWELASSTRRVTITKFGYGKSKDTVRVDIREFYEKEGKHLPGKKGISLSVEQYNALLGLIPSINAVLTKEGQAVGGPGAEPMEIEMENNGEAVASEPRRVKSKQAKSNIEATSDEDEE